MTFLSRPQFAEVSHVNCRALVVDGTYGFRIGRGTNLHISYLDQTRRHAPFPAPRP